MKHFFILTLFLLTVMACGEGRVDLITKDVISDAASCYESVEVVDDTYMVALDKTCIDLELSGVGGISPRPVATQVEPTIDWEQVLASGEWEHLATLPRNNLNPDHFRMVDEYIDPLTSAYVEGKDFIFVIYTESQIRQQQFFLIQPEPPPLPEYDQFGELIPGTPSALQVWHFPDPDAWWFQYWGNARFQNREKAGFTVAFDVTPMFEPTNPEHKKQREYLFSPQFGTSLDGLGVGSGAAPEIKRDYQLKIYVR